MHRKEPTRRLGEPPNYLAQTLREWRAKNGWPLKKVAAEIGVTEATWSRWESGDRFPVHALIQPLADFVHVPVCRFFCSSEPRCPYRVQYRLPALANIPAGTRTAQSALPVR